MNSNVKKVLIIGGGFSGMSAAIQLRKLGIDVDLVETDKQWQAYGAGLTIGGAALRAMKTLGVLPQVIAKGAVHDGATICAPNGIVLAELTTPRIAGPDVPGSGAIMRPILARILSEATLASGACVRLGVTYTHLDQSDTGVDVAFTDGTSGTYDLVIGADGLMSSVRKTLFPDAPAPQYTGQGVWRAVVPRPASVVHSQMYLGHKVKAGVNPVSNDEMYMFVTEDRPVNEFIDPKTWLATLKELLSGFGGVIGAVRDGLGEHSQIIYRPLEALLMPLPWSSGRVILIGDTVHATTPHLASGAGIGIEDAVVLAEEIAKGGELGQVLERHQLRRWERCRMVVENSLRLGEIEQTGGSKEEHSRLMQDSMTALAAPV